MCIRYCNFGHIFPFVCLVFHKRNTDVKVAKSAFILYYLLVGIVTHFMLPMRYKKTSYHLSVVYVGMVYIFFHISNL